MTMRGQVLLESVLTLALVVVPVLVLGVIWGKLELERVRCSLLTFQEARALLIQTDAPVSHAVRCKSGVQERIDLLPLEALQNE